MAYPVRALGFGNRPIVADKKAQSFSRSHAPRAAARMGCFKIHEVHPNGGDFPNRHSRNAFGRESGVFAVYSFRFLLPAGMWKRERDTGPRLRSSAGVTPRGESAGQCVKRHFWATARPVRERERIKKTPFHHAEEEGGTAVRFRRSLPGCRLGIHFGRVRLKMVVHQQGRVNTIAGLPR